MLHSKSKSLEVDGVWSDDHLERIELDHDSPESNQFNVSKGRTSGRVLGAAVVARCRCCDVGVAQ